MSDVNLTTVDGVNATGRSAVTPIRVGEGNANTAWYGKDGAAISLPWLQALVLEGRCFTATVGTLSTGIVGGGNGTVPELAEPEFVIGVPAGAVILPFRIAVQGNCANAVADHDVLEVIIAAMLGTAYDGTGTATTEVAYNLRTDNPKASLCSVKSAFTADITIAPVATIDLARTEVHVDATSAIALGTIVVDCLYQPTVVPFIVGPAILFGMWGGTTAVTGYAQLYWAEFAKSELGI